jgi:hypothetical protein
MTIKDFDELEQQLLNNLNPVKPDPEFVSHLRYRLANPDNVTLEKRSQISILLILIAAGLFSGAMVVWLLRRLW